MNLANRKKKRLHEGGVGPKMRSPAGLSNKNTTIGARGAPEQAWKRAVPE